MKAYPDKAILDRAWARFRAGGHKATSFSEEGGVIALVCARCGERLSYNPGAGHVDGPAAYGTCRAQFTPSRAAAPAEGDDNGGQLPLFGDTNG